MKRILSVLLLATSVCFARNPLSEGAAEERRAESKKVRARCEALAYLWDLKPGEHVRNITSLVLQEESIPEVVRNAVEERGSEIYVFQFNSDGYQVKGYASIVPDAENFVCFLRGGNRIFGLMPPANRFNLMEKTNVVGLSYRGSVSEGKDEFGGGEVNDVAYMVSHIPTLEEALGRKILTDNRYIVGCSRGGMELVLALARHPHLQDFFQRGLVLTGMLDIEECMRVRPRMKQMFINDFGYEEGVNDAIWIPYRNPVDQVKHIRSDFPLIVVHGSEDIRVSRQEAENFVHKRQELGGDIEYILIEGGEHGLKNIQGVPKMILDWLQQ